MAKEPTEVQTTIYEGFEGDRKEVQTTVPVLDPHELLDYLQTECKLVCPLEKVRKYWKHLRENGNPFALAFPGSDSHVPFTIYGDELTLGKDAKDKVTGIFLQLTLFKPRAARQGMWLICAVQDAVMVHDNMQTLKPLLEHIVWSCNLAFEGRYPCVSKDGAPLGGLKAQKAGAEFAGGARFACCEYRGDWKWHERTLRLLRTPVSKKCCFLCDAEATDNALRYYDVADGAAWRTTQLDTNGFLAKAIRPGVQSLLAMTAFSKWFSGNEAMLHLLEQSHKWRILPRIQVITHATPIASLEKMPWGG
ncbi:hypothetical protein AK812_SmicGene44430 [Symbiodinium microadriaticum]|uniref:Uncharacterized protein n=1 Tax=Symbiodinium microadriaticum TaxID=2951 RepID=A0A1Q9BYI0_SYMMI|nr:hypothetical protein AK812_SmicGene44430 [Symbiodinium microadriaticum]